MAAEADGVSITITSAPSLDDVRALESGLFPHARDFVPPPGSQPLAVLARDAQGRLVGGVVASVRWSWLHVSPVWVAEELRGAGLGALLLAAVEDAGRARGCRHARLDASSDRARPFYERHGWRVFATLAHDPEGDPRPFLRKDL